MSIKRAIISDDLPKDATPVLNLGFDISKASSKKEIINVFEAVKISEDKEKILDKTFQCHNKDFMLQSDAKAADLLLDDGSRRLMIEEQRIEIDEKAKLTDEQKAAVKRLEGAIINKERLVSENELDELLNSYATAEPAIENKTLNVNLIEEKKEDDETATN